MDGTLIDSWKGITRSIKYALGEIGIEVNDKKDLVSFVGPPIKEALRYNYGLDEKKIDEFLIYYRRRYSSEGLHESVMFKGTKGFLKMLKKQGRDIYLATSKPELYAKEILKNLDAAKYFSGIHGASMDEKIVEKIDILNNAIKEHDLALKESIMVGDRVYDIHAAMTKGVDSVFFRAGYADEKEAKMLKKEATYTVKDTKELISLFERI